MLPISIAWGCIKVIALSASNGVLDTVRFDGSSTAG